MDITFKRSRSTAIFGVLLIALAAVSGAMAAPTVDSETTTTTTTSDLTDGTTQATFNASNDVQLPTLQASYATQNPEIRVIDPETGSMVKSITNDSAPDMFTSTGGTGPYYYNTTFNESFFATVPMDAGESKNITLRLIDNSSDTDITSTDMTNITVTLENTNERAVYNALADDQTGVDVEENEPGTLRSLFGAESENTSNIEADAIGINGSETTVYMVYGDSSVAEPFETAAEDRSRFLGLSSGSYSAGDSIGDQIVRAEGVPYVVYSSEAPESVLDASGATYATYETVDGEPAHRIVLGDDFDGETTVDVETAGNEELGLYDQYVNQVSFEGGLLSMSLGFGGLGALLLFGGRPSIKRENDDVEA